MTEQSRKPGSASVLIHLSSIMDWFKSHKQVQAGIIRAVENEDDSGMEVIIAHPDVDDLNLAFTLTPEMIARYKPKAGDYVVLYDNDYLSISPKEAFESGYRSLQGTQNKISKSHIDRLVSSLRFEFARVGDTTVTGCWAFLPDGFKVGYGESSCVDPERFSFETGCHHAKERCIQDATNKLWELEGYLLKVTGTDSSVMPTSISKLPEPSPERDGFMVYKSKPTERTAYQIRESDMLHVVTDNKKRINIGGVDYEFAHHEPVKAGDFICFLSDDDICHVRKEVMAERNYL